MSWNFVWESSKYFPHMFVDGIGKERSGVGYLPQRYLSGMQKVLQKLPAADLYYGKRYHDRDDSPERVSLPIISLIGWPGQKV
jgi:hypothetical protein